MDTVVRPFIDDAETWAEEQWSNVTLGDARLERRAVELGAQMAKLPGASLSQRMESGAQSKATYRFLDNAKASHEKLQRPRWAATRERAGKERVVLLVQDVTELDYTVYAETMVALGSIGDGRGHGLLMRGTLAIIPWPRRVLGIALQQVFKRVSDLDKKKRRQRPKKERESRVWGEAVRDIGPPPEGSRWVVVADRGADNTDFFSPAARRRAISTCAWPMSIAW